MLLGLVALSRYRLLPGLEETATYVEGLGAAIIMFPSFLQSLEGGRRYELNRIVPPDKFGLLRERENVQAARDRHR